MSGASRSFLPTPSSERCGGDQFVSQGYFPSASAHDTVFLFSFMSSREARVGAPRSTPPTPEIQMAPPREGVAPFSLEVGGVDPSGFGLPALSLQGRVRSLAASSLMPHSLSRSKDRAKGNRLLPVRLPPHRKYKWRHPVKEWRHFRWRWGESNPRPRTRTGSVYRFIRPFGLSRKGQRTDAPSFPYSGVCPLRPPDWAKGKPWLGCRVLRALKAAHPRPRRYRRLRGESEVAIVVGK